MYRVVWRTYRVVRGRRYNCKSVTRDTNREGGRDDEALNHGDFVPVGDPNGPDPKIFQ
jgi:hypothetical protein